MYANRLDANAAQKQMKSLARGALWGTFDRELCISVVGVNTDILLLG